MKFKEYQSNQTELTEAKKHKLSNVQPMAGKKAVDDRGIDIDNSVVLGKGLVAIGGKFGPGDQIELFDFRKNKLLVALPNDALKTLRKIK